MVSIPVLILICGAQYLITMWYLFFCSWVCFGFKKKDVEGWEKLKGVVKTGHLIAPLFVIAAAISILFV